MIYTLTLNPSMDYLLKTTSLELGGLNKATETALYAGGKGINVARVLHRLDTEVTCWGFVGGFTGLELEQRVEQERLATDFIHISDETRINLKLKGATETEINALGPQIQKEEQRQLSAQFSQLTDNDLVVLSGSLPRNVPEDFYLTLITRIAEQKAQFVLDTSGPQLLASLAYKPYLLKPNHHELAEIAGKKLTTVADIVQFGQKIQAQGAQNMIVSLGKDGALLFTSDGIYQADAPDGVLVNSVGAGDSMIAGFLAKKMMNLPTLDAFRYAVAAGSATAFTSDLATSSEINELYSSITYRKLSTI